MGGSLNEIFRVRVPDLWGLTYWGEGGSSWTGRGGLGGGGGSEDRDNELPESSLLAYMGSSEGGGGGGKESRLKVL